LDEIPPGFTWDQRKAHENTRKHDVSFVAAAGVFDDPAGLLEADPVHSEDEERRRLIGRSSQGLVLLIVFVERRDTIRIISARLARRSERIRYEQEAHKRGY